MLDVVLVEPEIPPNTGNVIRLAANTGARLHLVKPLGFSLDDKNLKRAGLDYHEYASMVVHDSWQAFATAMRGRRMFAFATKAERLFTDVQFARDDVLIFGKEASGLSPAIVETFAPEMRLRLPMRPGNRSLNLSNAVAVAVFEAWRQLGFAGAQ
ncbi:MAG TPA: tRNA (cytidine(34)-2'-O)-methyltransferase [Burkholderiales bacterium]|jgi:tRNA (cytidine/uridine-2'-O-)-methyltransferase|nr:tRNA (cytidine(34)-2'-O)-methyltransferase [Burkholderiales bacterium]